MPYLITTANYPSDKAPDVAKMNLEAITKYPPDENLATEVVPAAVKATSKGLKVLTIMDVKKLQSVLWSYPVSPNLFLYTYRC